MKLFFLPSLKRLARSTAFIILAYLFIFFLYIMNNLSMNKTMLDLNAIKERAQIRSLNHLMPNTYDVLFTEVNGREDINQTKLQSYIAYYKKIIEIIPNNFVAHGMLGYCFYLKGDKDRAIDHYQKAVALNSHFFWFHYNLGVIYFERQQYEKAIESFKQAVNKDPEITLRIIHSSRLFNQIKFHSKELEPTRVASLKKGYRDAFVGLALSSKQLKDFKGMLAVSALAIKSDLVENDIFYYYAGQAAINLKEYKEALYFLQESIKRNKENPDSFFYLAEALKQLGKEEIAQGVLQQAVYLRQFKSKSPFEEGQISLKIF